MKINNCRNLYNYTQFCNLGNKQHNDNVCFYNFDYSLNEAIGRSQVNFAGTKNQDKKYQ